MSNNYREMVDKMYIQAKKRSKFEMLLARIFGKKISTNMLRNIYVSDKYGSMKQGMIEDGLAMGTSVKVQQGIYNKGE